MKIMTISITNGNHHIPTGKSTLHDKFDKKEGTGKSMKRMHYMYSGMSKGTSEVEGTSKSKKSNPVKFF